jgi:hypothetical protein
VNYDLEMKLKELVVAIVILHGGTKENYEEPQTG